MARIQYASPLKVADDWRTKPLSDRAQIGAGVNRAGADHDHWPVGALQQPHGLDDRAEVRLLRLSRFGLACIAKSKRQPKDIRRQFHRRRSMSCGKGSKGT